jgi:hypothetical protein
LDHSDTLSAEGWISKMAIARAMPFGGVSGITGLSRCQRASIARQQPKNFSSMLRKKRN